MSYETIAELAGTQFRMESHMRRAARLSASLALSLGVTTLALTAHARTQVLGTGHTPSIASNGKGKMCIVFEGMNEQTGVSDVYCSISDDGGKTWTPRVDVSPTVGVSTRPRVAIESSGAIDVVWTDTAFGENNPDIFFSRSADYGRTWSRATNISHTPGASRDPEIAVGPNNELHVVFAETPASDLATRDICYSTSYDGGKTWTEEHSLENVSQTKSDSAEASLAVGADGIVHVAWKEENASALDRPQIYYSHRTASGWAPGINVSKNLRYSYHPVIACGANGNVFINWLDRARAEGAADIWCITVKDSVPIEPPTKITHTGSIASAAEMTADKSNRIAIVWPDRALGLNLPRIRIKTMANGTSNPSHSKKFAHNSSVQLAPAVAIDGNNLTVTWEERRLDRNPIKVRSFNLNELLSTR